MLNENPKYLFNFIPTRRLLYSTRNMHNIPPLNTEHNFFKNSFLASTIIEWKNLDPHLRKYESFLVLKAIFFNSFDHLQTLFIIIITLEQFVILQDIDLA